MENKKVSRWFSFSNIVLSFVGFLVFDSALAAATTSLLPPRSGLFDGQMLMSITLESAVQKVEPGGVLILSELHGNPLHIERQLEALTALKASGQCTVSVGLEFLSWVYQDSVDQYFAGTLAESDFLKAVDWGSDPFDNYRAQALFPQTTMGKLVAINAPRTLTSAIAKTGISGLTPEQAALLPAGFALGSAAYRERFEAIMGGHAPTTTIDRYFAAQSAWDDTMADQAQKFLSKNPSHCLAIVVGDFHAMFGGGLPDRLRARGVANVTVVSQIESSDLTDGELSEELGPHPKYGPRADAVWVSNLKP